MKIRKTTFSGTVDSARMRNTVNVKRVLRVMIKKYERYAKRYYSLKAHNPICISAKKGDIVVVAECRPISKSKHFVVVSKKSNKSVEE